MTCDCRCNKDPSVQAEYLEGSKYCSICKKFMRTERVYCFCCKYMLSNYTVEENHRKVNLLKFRFNRCQTFKARNHQKNG